MRELRLPGATARRRTAAALVDLFPCALLGAAPFGLHLFAWRWYVPPADRFLPDHLLEQLAARPFVLVGPPLWLLFVWITWHLAWMALAQGQTPGCIALGLRCVDRWGDPIRASHAALRALGHALAAFSLGLGWAWAWISPQRRTWPDLLSRTYLLGP